MSTFELVSSIKDSLSKKGVLNSIRAQLKAGILEAINDENVPLSFKSNERAGTFLGDKAGRVSLDVVKELLESLELKHTLSALHAELGIASTAVDREGLAKELRAPPDYSIKEPLLLHLLQTRSSSLLSSPKVRATSPKAVGASPASPTVVAPLPLDREPVAVAASKTLSQRRAISLSVTPDKSSSPPSSKSPALSPVAQSEFGGSNKPRSPTSLSSPVESTNNRNRLGILNPLPQVTLSSSSKLAAALTTGGGKIGQVLALAKGGKLLNLSDNNPLQSSEVQQIAQFLVSQTQLESLHLGNCGITDDAFTQLFGSILRLVKLKEINLANNVLTTVDPHLFLLPSLKSCVLDGNRLPPVLSEATFAELRMYGKQKTQLSASISSHEGGPEESDDHDISSSFEIDSPEKQPGMQKARSPLSSLSRAVEVHSKTSADKVEINNSTVLRDSRGSVARSKSGWGSSGSARGGDERDTTDDDDFVFAEDGNKAGGASGGGESGSLGARRLINPLNNRATSRPRGNSARQSPGGDDLLEQSMGSNQEESDILQKSYVSNQDEEIEALPSIAPTSKAFSANSKAPVDYTDEYGEDDFEDIEEDFSVQDESSDNSGAKFDESSELSPNLQGNRGASALSRTKSGFITTVKGKSQGGEIVQHSEDEADEEAHEDSSPTMDKMKGRGRVLQALTSESSYKTSSVARTDWAKMSSSTALSGGLTRKQLKFGGMTAADIEDQSVASEEIDALEFSVGNADSDSNASFSFVHNDDSVLSSHRAGAQQMKVLGGTAEKFSVNSSTGSAGGKSSKAYANASSESVEVDYSEAELSTSGQGLYDYDYTTSALPPVLGRPPR